MVKEAESHQDVHKGYNMQKCGTCLIALIALRLRDNISTEKHPKDLYAIAAQLVELPTPTVKSANWNTSNRRSCNLEKSGISMRFVIN